LHPFDLFPHGHKVARVFLNLRHSPLETGQNRRSANRSADEGGQGGKVGSIFRRCRALPKQLPEPGTGRCVQAQRHTVCAWQGVDAILGTARGSQIDHNLMHACDPKGITSCMRVIPIQQETIVLPRFEGLGFIETLEPKTQAPIVLPRCVLAH